jgi:hypothetical protein
MIRRPACGSVSREEEARGERADWGGPGKAWDAAVLEERQVTAYVLNAASWRPMNQAFPATRKNALNAARSWPDNFRTPIRVKGASCEKQEPS